MRLLRQCTATAFRASQPGEPRVTIAEKRAFRVLLPLENDASQPYPAALRGIVVSARPVRLCTCQGLPPLVQGGLRRERFCRPPLFSGLSCLFGLTRVRATRRSGTLSSHFSREVLSYLGMAKSDSTPKTVRRQRRRPSSAKLRCNSRSRGHPLR